MDPVSISLGVVPLCLSAIKGVKVVKGKIKLLRHHSRDTARFRKRFRTQVSVFLDEFQLLLQDVGTEVSLVSEMVDDCSHDYWDSPELEEELKKHLGRRYDDFQDTVREIGDHITAFDEELGSLEDEHANRGKTAMMRHRAQNAVAMAFSKTKLDEGIETLNESIHELRRLRKLAKAVQKHETTKQVQRRSLPPAYGTLARHSASFHEVFIKAWSCLDINGTHARHTASLLLDPDETNDGTDLRLILEYESVSGALRQNSLLLLRIRSEDIGWVGTGLLTHQISPCSRQEADGPPRKVRRVRFDESSVKDAARTKVLETSQSSQMAPHQATAHNLCKSKNLCQDIFSHASSFCSSQREACIGYLDAQGHLRHRLITPQDRKSTAIQTRARSTVKLSSIFEPPNDSNLSVHEQLRLALRLARSVLQYHSTPWWRSTWSLADLSYFSIDSELAVSLSTLHIDTKLPRRGMLEMDYVLARVPTLTSTDGDDDARIFCGIRNMTIFNLGVALLQIGRWEVLDTDDVVRIRRAASKPSKLGPRYDELTQRCLNCDFGFGDDLEKPQLQCAVYESVVCELEHMVRLLGG